MQEGTGAVEECEAIASTRLERCKLFGRSGRYDTSVSVERSMLVLAGKQYDRRESKLPLEHFR